MKHRRICHHIYDLKKLPISPLMFFPSFSFLWSSCPILGHSPIYPSAPSGAYKVCCAHRSHAQASSRLCTNVRLRYNFLQDKGIYHPPFGQSVALVGQLTQGSTLRGEVFFSYKSLLQVSACQHVLFFLVHCTFRLTFAKLAPSQQAQYVSLMHFLSCIACTCKARHPQNKGCSIFF